MSVIKSLNDYLLKVEDRSAEVLDIVNKYETALDILCSDRYSFQKEAIRTALTFLVSQKYSNTQILAEENYSANIALKSDFETFGQLLDRIPLYDKKSITLELVTGAGKSYVMYALARIALAEGLVDKVLVLCPSLTIEEGLKDKFYRLGSDTNLNTVLSELGAVWNNPDIKSANQPIEPGDICVENIHAVYERTGTSVADSFKGLGDRTLILNDEAHHVFSSDTKWLKFLQNSEYGFNKIINVTGTPYIGNDYFSDVIYRYGMRAATEAGVVKRIDYIKAREQGSKDHGWDETWQYHDEYRTKYSGVLKPITIVVTQEISDCIRVWNELVIYLMEKEGLTREEAQKRTIWVTSSVPTSNKQVKEILGDKSEAKRKENIQMLKSVDERENPVEWIVSVSMLTEGWDVKNVFQVVPHENRAFNSKLLISQVLGRGLRIPAGVQKPMLTVNNHEKWESQITKIMEEVLEVENRLSWGYFDGRSQYAFPLHSLHYESEQQGEETKEKPANDPEKVDYSPQSKNWEDIVEHSLRGTVNVVIENRDTLTIQEAVRRLKVFLNQKDTEITKRWSSTRIETFIIENLKRLGQPTDFISKENLVKTQQAFAPLFRIAGKTAPRMVMKAQNVIEIDMSDMKRQSFSESVLLRDANVFYTEDVNDTFENNDAKNLWSDYYKSAQIAEQFGKDQLPSERQMLVENLRKKDLELFKTPNGILVSGSEPEKKFIERLLLDSKYFDGFIKSPDKGFYSFPYSYKPETQAKTHVKQENFNPDFFIKLSNKNEVLVIEIKKDDDDNNKNRAKKRDGQNHFKELNKRLKEEEKDWIYHFYFLSPSDYPTFFQAIKDGNYQGWKSNLMITLEQ